MFIIENLIGISLSFIHKMAERETNKSGLSVTSWPSQYRSPMLFYRLSKLLRCLILHQILILQVDGKKLSERILNFSASDYESYISTYYVHAYAIAEVSQRLRLYSLEASILSLCERIQLIKSFTFLDGLPRPIVENLIKVHDIKSAKDMMLAPSDMIVSHLRILSSMDRLQLLTTIVEMKKKAEKVHKEKYRKDKEKWRKEKRNGNYKSKK